MRKATPNTTHAGYTGLWSPFPQARTVHQFKRNEEIVILCEQYFTQNQSLNAFTFDKGIAEYSKKGNI